MQHKVKAASTKIQDPISGKVSPFTKQKKADSSEMKQKNI